MCAQLTDIYLCTCGKISKVSEGLLKFSWHYCFILYVHLHYFDSIHSLSFTVLLSYYYWKYTRQHYVHITLIFSIHCIVFIHFISFILYSSREAVIQVPCTSRICLYWINIIFMSEKWKLFPSVISDRNLIFNWVHHKYYIKRPVFE